MAAAETAADLKETGSRKTTNKQDRIEAEGNNLLADMLFRKGSLETRASV